MRFFLLFIPKIIKYWILIDETASYSTTHPHEAVPTIRIMDVAKGLES